MTLMLKEILEESKILPTLEEVNASTFSGLCEVLRKRKIKNVTLAARGTSDHAAIYGQYLLSIVCGVTAGLAVPSAISLYGADIDLSDTLVIAISQSGKAADALAVIEAGNRHGAETLAITNYTDSPLAKAAKWHLFCNAGEEKAVAATKTFTAQLALTYLLAAHWAKREDMLSAFPSLAEKLNELAKKAEKEIKSIALPYRYMDNGFVLSRGIGYPIALETMLKIQETCYARIKGYSSADFYHGPIAQIERDTPVILYLLKGSAFNDNMEMANKLRGLGVEPFIVTDSKELHAEAPCSYLIPEADHELAAPIILAEFAQLFAEALCALKGLDPDTPRNLNKVTVTR